MYAKIEATYKIFMAFLLMSISGIIALILKYITFGKSTNWGSKYIVASSSRLILRIIGIRAKLPRTRDYPDEQVMYTFNHNSFLDVLILTALGVPNTRFFLSEKTRKIIPLTISAMAIGVHYIPVKRDKKRRASFFERMTTKLKEGKESVFVASEGVHEFIHGIAPFNRGVYEMALQAKVPIQLIYIHIPKKTNMLQGYRLRPGTIKVSVFDQVVTANWESKNLTTEIKKVRTKFINEFGKRNG
jgi:1-acyl-sn-glycerol-3-phosphate acyltransferase